MQTNFMVYYSKMNNVHAGDLRDISSVSSKNNREHDITGALVQYQGYFVQVLEGSRADLSILLSNLMRDPRHSQIILAVWDDLEERHFGEWSMEVVQLGREAEPLIAGYGFDRLFDPAQMSGRELWEFVYTVAGPEAQENGFVAA